VIDNDINDEKFSVITPEITQLILEEQTEISNAHILKIITESRARILKLLKSHNKHFFSNIESSDAFLRSHVDSKIHLIILYIDIAGSTYLSTVLPLSDLTTILQVFTQEMTIVIVNNYGYVLKYVGDAIIAYFPVDDNFYLASRNAICCALNMLTIVEQAINPVLKEFDFPELHVKIGIDSGENAIVGYAFSRKSSHIDIIGYPMNIAAKITSLAKPNHILIGNSTYSGLNPKLEHTLRKLGLENSEYIDYQTGDAYIIYSLSVK
jgi:adenylate cyclase